jgi:cobalt-zinc-cadmium efflux system outer membrane protein
MKPWANSTSTPKRSRANLRIGLLASLLAGSIAGCQTPAWWAYRSMDCVPKTADNVATQYLQTCGEVPATNTSTLGSSDPLKLPPELPGTQTPDLIAPLRDKLDPQAYQEELKRLYPEPSTIPSNAIAMPDPAGGVSALESLHELARQNHPGLKAAVANVEVARGLMIQAGLPPNPSVGYQADTVRTINTPGYHGAYLQQTVVTAQKLGLAAEAAAVDYANAMVEQRKTWITVMTEIRRAYFDVLAARQRMVLASAFFDLTHRAYEAQIQLVTAGEAAPYEPLQLRVILTQARASVIKSQQESIAAWRRLGAAVGCPDLQATPIDGRIDCSVPAIQYEEALARMNAVHTDLEMAENAVRKQQTLVELADRQVIPDVNVGFVLQRDYTFEPGTTTYNLMLGGDLPVLNRNQGNRIARRAEAVRASQQVQNTRNTLTAALANAFGKYEANRQLAESFQSEALRDQVRAYRGVYQRYLADPASVSFNDVIVAQQTVAQVLNQYLDILQSQWQSLVDIGELLQVDDLMELGPLSQVATVPDVTE